MTPGCFNNSVCFVFFFLLGAHVASARCESSMSPLRGRRLIPNLPDQSLGLFSSLIQVCSDPPSH